MARDFEVLDDMRDHLYQKLLDSGLDNRNALTIAHQLRDHFRKHWGGQTIYFTKSLDLSERDLEIYTKFNGTNKEELLREYDITEQWFYKIVRREKENYIARTQFPLFLDENNDENKGD